MIILSWAVGIQDLLQPDTKSTWPLPERLQQWGAFTTLTLREPTVCVCPTACAISFVVSYDSQATAVCHLPETNRQNNRLELLICQESPNELYHLFLNFIISLCLCVCYVPERACRWGEGQVCHGMSVEA